MDFLRTRVGEGWGRPWIPGSLGAPPIGFSRSIALARRCLPFRGAPRARACAGRGEGAWRAVEELLG
eukprot:2270799-Pyramimonas_sp.AAC.1